MAENEKKVTEAEAANAPATEVTDTASAKKNASEGDNALTEKGRLNEAIENAMLAENEDEDDDALLFDSTPEPIALTVENAHFFKSPTGLISLTLTRPDGKIETFERVIAIRCFPITNPMEFISIREPESKQVGCGIEIGMIRRLSDFPADVQALLSEELDRRYFTPIITKITSMYEKFAHIYITVETDAGNVEFILNSPHTNVRVFEDRSVYLYDIDGNCFKIPETSKLDPQSFHKIEIYL